MVKVSTALAGFALLVSSLAGAAAIEKRDSNPTNMQYCTDSDFHGKCEWVNEANNRCNNFVAPFANQISSIRLSKDVSCKFYKDKNCSGKYIGFPKGGSRSRNLKKYGFNDQISSFKCKIDWNV